MVTRTYQQALANLNNGFVSVGHIQRDTSNDAVDINQCHPLMWIVYEFREIKRTYAHALMIKDQLTEAELNEIPQIEVIVNSLHDIIQDAILTLPTQELLAINWNEGPIWSPSLAACLGEIGDVDLFNILIEKICAELSMQDWVNIHKSLQKAYEGTALTEALNLGSSLLHRGDLCFIEMTRFMFTCLIAENKLDTFFLTLFGKEFSDEFNELTIKEPLDSQNNSRMMTREEYLKKHNPAYSKYCGEKIYNEQYDRFVANHNKKHLFVQLTIDYFIPCIVKNSTHEKIYQQKTAPSLVCVSAINMFKQNSYDNFIIHDSLAGKLLMFAQKSKPETIQHLDDNILEELKSVKFKWNVKK